MQGTRIERRVLGSDHLLATLLAAFPPRSHIDPGRSRRAAELRVLILHHALQLRIASLSDVARYFNRSASTLSESLEHYRRADPALFNTSINLKTP